MGVVIETGLLSLRDILLLPFYILLLFALTYYWRHRHYANTQIGTYMLPAFWFKMFCNVVLLLLNKFYYGYGDTFGYFTATQKIYDAFFKDSAIALELIFTHYDNYSPEAMSYVTGWWWPIFGKGGPTNLVCQISGFLSLFTFCSYAVIGAIFSYLAFLGSWFIFKVFVQRYPTLHKEFAVACFFLPSVAIWTTCILKDPLCFFGLGLLTFALFDREENLFSLKKLCFALLGYLLITSIKEYIFYTFVTAIAAALFFNFKVKTSDNIIKAISFISKALLTCVVFYFILGKLGSYINNFKYSPEAGQIVASKAAQLSDGAQGSAYDLGELDFSAAGMTKLSLASLEVSLFRPYLWEIKKPIMLVNALESLLVFFITLYIVPLAIYKQKFGLIFQNYILTLSFVFSIFLGIVVGFLSFNFGTLVRYKLPFLPFYFSGLAILYFEVYGKPFIADVFQKKHTNKSEQVVVFPSDNH